MGSDLLHYTAYFEFNYKMDGPRDNRYFKSYEGFPAMKFGKRNGSMGHFEFN